MLQISEQHRTCIKRKWQILVDPNQKETEEAARRDRFSKEKEDCTGRQVNQ
jgi:hypothetical protein